MKNEAAFEISLRFLCYVNIHSEDIVKRGYNILHSFPTSRKFVTEILRML